jgi:tetratricopeptide (TPR) repeat protein
VAQRLPYRLLWYQIEPISAYFKQKDYDKVFASTEQIFKSGNPSASELYQLRGESYLELGNKSAAKAEFEKALIYNNKYQPARESLNKI